MRRRLLVTMLAAIAEFKRELIRERTGEGRARALAAGVRFGRKPKLSDFQRKEALDPEARHELAFPGRQVAEIGGHDRCRSVQASLGQSGPEPLPGGVEFGEVTQRSWSIWLGGYRPDQWLL